MATLRYHVTSFLVIAVTCQYTFSLNVADYDRHHQVDTGYDFYWKIQDDTIRAALRADTNAWVGFGLGEAGSGGMAGADMVVCSAGADGVVVVTDRHATALSEPYDDKIQDWTISSGSASEGVIICEISRKLHTADKYGDRNISDNGIPVPLVFAHSTLAQAPGTFGFHSTNKWTYLTDLFRSTSIPSQIESKSDYGNFTDFHVNRNIPNSQVTTYIEQCFSSGELFTEKASAFGFEVLMTSAVKPYVHHIVMTAFTGSACDGVRENIFTWVPGMPALLMPDDVGFSFGIQVPGGEGYRAFHLQYHYENPDLLSGILDESGVRIYSTVIGGPLRGIEAGTIGIGDNLVYLNGESIPVGVSQHEFVCNSTSTSQMPHDITVLFHLLHMHETGIMQETNVTRGGELIANKRVEYYIWDRQANIAGQYVIKPGDDVTTRCSYSNRNASRTFGQASAEEMCIDFLVYYPRIPSFTACDLSDSTYAGVYVGNTVLASDNDLGRSFGSASARSNGTEDEVDAPVESGSTDVAIIAGATVGGVLVVVVLGAVLWKRQLRQRATRPST